MSAQSVRPLQSGSSELDRFSRETVSWMKRFSAGPMLLAASTMLAPSYSFEGNPQLGMYQLSTEQVGFTTPTNGLALEVGNATIKNLDTFAGHTPATVRYNLRPHINPIAGATETTAFYCRLSEDAAATTFQYAIYIEIPSLQNYTYGGSGTKVIHRGHGDAHFVALLNGIDAKTIVGATNTSPIVCTIPDHGFGQGDIVQIAGCLGNTAANRVWYGITVLDANRFSLPGSTGNGAYTASSGSAQDIDPPVGYEGAVWGDGCTSFLASCQYPGGRANWTGINFLYQADAILNYGGFVGNEVPNHCFTVNKRIGLADTLIDGYSQYEIVDSLHRMLAGDGGGTGYTGGYNPVTVYTVGQTVVYGLSAYKALNAGVLSAPPSADWTDVTDTANLGRQRWAAFNNGQQLMASLAANATTTTYDAPQFHQRGSYYDAGAAHDFDYIQAFHVSGTAAGMLYQYIGDPSGSPHLCLTLTTSSSGGQLSVEGGCLVNCINLQSNSTQFDLYAAGASAVTFTNHASMNSGDTAMLLTINQAAVFTTPRVKVDTVANVTAAGGKVLYVS